MQALPLLQAPVWERQTNEEPHEHDAFRSWYWGNGTTKQRPARDWQLVQRLGYTPDEARALAMRWAWETRAAEFERSNAELVRASRVELKGTVDALLASQAVAARASQELFIEELRKLLEISRTYAAPSLAPKDLIRLGTLAAQLVKGLDSATAGTASAADDAPQGGVNWGALSGDELEQARKLFERARATAKVGG